MAKTDKSAQELSDIIRKHLAEPKIRVGVFAEPNGGWRATVYVDHGSASDLQRRVDEVAQRLNERYALS